MEQNTQPKQNELTPHLQERGQLLMQQKTEIKNTLQLLIRQSHDIFATYGSEPEAFESIYLGFIKVLEHCSVEEVQKAFSDWLTTRKTMPRPCNILSRCLPDYPERPDGSNLDMIKQYIQKSNEIKELRFFMTGGIDPDDIERG